MIARPVVDGYLDAVRWAVAVAERPQVEATWDEPSALDGLTVGSLVSHELGGGVLRLDHVAGAEDRGGLTPVSLLVAYGGHRIDSPADLGKELPAYVRTLSDELARAGRASLLDAVAQARRALEVSLPAADADRLVPVLSVRGGGMSLESYVRTRVVELVVHTDDLLVSIGSPPEEPPRAAAQVAIDLMVELARARYGESEVIRSLARRDRAGAESFRVF
jgi:Mycothiol maleylpyruvate isomerase N-terminal domain